MRNHSEVLQGNAMALHLSDGRWAGVYFCSKCKMVRKCKEEAEKCCIPPRCASCDEEIEESRYYWNGQRHCSVCAHRRSDEREQAKWDAIEKVTPEEASEMVVIDGGERIEPLDEVVEMMESGEVERVWCCHQEWLSMDAGGIIENALCDWFDGAHDHIGRAAEEELQKLLDGWCEKHKFCQWTQDDKKGVVLK